MKLFLRRWWFLSVLALVLVAGIGLAEPLAFLTKAEGLRSAIVAGVLFVMALPLPASHLWETLRRPAAAILAVLLNFVAVPLLGWGLAQFVSPATLAEGLLVAAATPCTLASAAVWTRRAGGNDAVAILVTCITNVTCFFVTPLWLLATLNKTAAIDFAGMTSKLALIVVLPMVIAQLLRLAKPVGAWAVKQKTPLGVFAQTGILCMVFLGAIQTGLRLASAGGPAIPHILWMIAAVLLLHTLVLLLGLFLAALLAMRRGDRIAVALAGSQKTLMVGLNIAADLNVSILPMVCYHVGQLLVDTLFVDLWRRKHASEEIDSQRD